MGIRIQHAELLELLRIRYDYYSAESNLERTLRGVGVPSAESYSPEEVLSLADHLAVARAADGVTVLVEQLRYLAALASPGSVRSLPEQQERGEDREAGSAAAGE